MPKAVFSYSFIQLYYLPYIRLKPELPEQREEQSLELPALLIALLIACPALGYEPLALTFILRALHNKAFY